MNNNEHRGFPSADWIREMAELEGRFPWFSVGGLASEAGLLGSNGEPASLPAAPSKATAEEGGAGRIVFARFVDVARRSKGLSLEELAQMCAVDLQELVQVVEDYSAPSPRTVYRLARELDVPTEKLMELAGLVEPREETLEAGLRFAARSEPKVQLSEDERRAFEEFVKVLVEKSDVE